MGRLVGARRRIVAGVVATVAGIVGAGLAAVVSMIGAGVAIVVVGTIGAADLVVVTAAALVVTTINRAVLLLAFRRVVITIVEVGVFRGFADGGNAGLVGDAVQPGIDIDAGLIDQFAERRGEPGEGQCIVTFFHRAAG